MPERNKFFIDRLLDEMAAGFCSLLTDAKAEKRFDRAIFESVFHIFTNKSASKQLGCWKGESNKTWRSIVYLYATQILHSCEAVNRCRRVWKAPGNLVWIPEHHFSGIQKKKNKKQQLYF